MLALGLLLGLPGAAAAQPVDIAIVVSLDRSESIDREDASAQITGLIHALNHPRFLAAVQSGAHGRIGLSVLTWSSFGRHDVILPWTQIAGAASAARAAKVLALDFDRELQAVHGTQTDVAFGIELGTQQMAELPWPAQQRVINMVGDGISNIGRVAIVDRDAALAQGITVNALITAQGSAIRVLTDYFRRNVIGGPTAFVQLTNGDDDFADAMLRKMLLEIARLNALTRGTRQRG
jgi:hypothetical protein